MAELPEEIIYDIQSRMPVKSLDRFRCVCKEWCKNIDEPNLAIIQMNRAIEEPILVMSKMHPDAGPTLVTLFRITESKQDEAKTNSVLEFEWEDPFTTEGSCNGLLYLSRCNYDCETTLSVIHPLRNERYELPPILAMQSCGLGFDASTNTFKMCVSVRKREENNNTVHTMVHVLGTDSWREIPQIPYYRMMGHGVFAHGCLHWLGYHKQLPFIMLPSDMPLPPNHRKKVIRFDVRKEEFGLIDTPKTGDVWIEMNLVDLHGEVGLVYINRHSLTMELWVLKQNNQWVIHCRFDGKPHLLCDRMDIVGIWNKSGDILVAADRGKRMFVYSLKSQGFHEINLVGWEDGCEAFIHLYRNSLFSSHGMKKPVSNPTVSSKEITRKRRRKVGIPFLMYLSSLHGMKKPGSKRRFSSKEKTRKRRKTSIHHN